MATVVKNGVAKLKTNAPKKAVQEQLAKDAIGKKQAPIEAKPTTEASKPIVATPKPTVNLDDRMEKFEQLKGLAHQRTRLAETLSQLNKFTYNQSDSAKFEIRDSQNLSFATTNSNLIQLVTTNLKETLQTRKSEIESKLLEFEL